MATVRCAICGRQYPPKEMYYCSHDQFWLCRAHVSSGFLSGPKCPRCGRDVKGH